MDSTKHVRMLNLSLILLLGTAFAIYLSRLLLQGQRLVPSLIVAGVIGLLTLFFLKDKYWYTVPASMVLGVGVVSLGGRDLALAEIIVPATFIFSLFRATLLRNKIRLFPPKSHGLWLYFLWVALIFSMNPSGLLMFGSTTFGARYYYKILCGFLAYLTLINVRITDKDCRNIIWIMLIGLVVTAVRGIAGWRAIDPDLLDGSFYTWQQALAAPALLGLIVLVARYKLKGVFFESFWRTGAFALCIFILLLSGKRAALAVGVSVPGIQVLIDRQGWRTLINYCACGLAALMLLVMLSVAGVIPPIAQRALAYVPGMVQDYRVEQDTRSTFRMYIRNYAWNEVVRKHPVVGLKGYALDYTELSSLLLLHRGGEQSGSQGHAVSRNWHNTWFGMAADFGIPAAVFWGIFWGQFFFINRDLYRMATPDSYSRWLLFVILISLITQMMRSWTSGHSALFPFEWWWQFGLVQAIGMRVRAQQSTEMAASNG